MKLIASALLTLLAASASQATVYFQNTGTRTGWDGYEPQQNGRVYETTSPIWGSSGTAIGYEQTWNNLLTGYHSECVKHYCQQNGENRYYGQVLRLSSNWVFHDRNITFQQFSPENPSGPWRLVWIQGTGLRTQTLLGNKTIATGIQSNRWYRIQTRLHLDSSVGAYQVWVDGNRTLDQQNIDQTVPGTWIRWSAGLYVTWWRTEVPASNLQKFTLYQDQFRIASSAGEVDANRW